MDQEREPDESDDASQDLDDAAIDRCLSLLMERFDSVQVFVLRHQPGRDGIDAATSRGRGAWYSRYGQVREWLVFEDQRMRREMDRRIDEGEA